MSRNRSAAGLDEAEQAALDELAPDRLGFIESSEVTSDVRFLPKGSGLARASHKDLFAVGFVTVLEDGFVVNTDALIRSGRSFSPLAVMALLTLQVLDPGLVILTGKSAREIYDAHVERVLLFVDKRKSAVRSEHERSLYFRFKNVGEQQLTRLVNHQMVPVLPMLVAGLIVGSGFFSRVIVAIAMAVAGFILGTLVYKLRRGTLPMLPPNASRDE